LATGNAVANLGHNYGQPPFGRSHWQRRALDSDRLGIKAKTQYQARPESWPADKAWTPDTAFALVQAGLMAGKAIGFLPLKWHSPDWRHRRLHCSSGLLPAAPGHSCGGQHLPAAGLCATGGVGHAPVPVPGHDHDWAMAISP
jgi:hypothetical protein